MDTPPSIGRVVILGGGVIGSSIAYHLTLFGVKPLVIERCAPACAASGKAGGFLAFDWSDGTTTEQLSRLSFNMHKQLAETFKDKHGVDYGFRFLDTLNAEIKDSKHVKKKAKVDSHLTDIDWIYPEKIGETMKLGSTSTTAQVHPALYTKALIEIAQRNGAELRIGTVTGLHYSENEPHKVTGVLLEDGAVEEADVVIIALGPWTTKSKEWLPSLPTITPHKAHSIVLRPSAAISPHAFFTDWLSPSKELLHPEVYPRPDGTVYICGMGADVDIPEDPVQVSPSPGACETLHTFAKEFSPVLKTSRVEVEQACCLPTPPDNLPIMGWLDRSKGIAIATGHSVWGILHSPASGLAMAELVAKGNASSLNLSPFDPLRPSLRD